MIAFFLWCILFVLCWPLALVALLAYPIVWLLLLPFSPRRNRSKRRAVLGLGRGYAARPAADCTVPHLILAPG